MYLTIIIHIPDAMIKLAIYLLIDIYQIPCTIKAQHTPIRKDNSKTL